MFINVVINFLQPRGAFNIEIVDLTVRDDYLHVVLCYTFFSSRFVVLSASAPDSRDAFLALLASRHLLSLLSGKQMKPAMNSVAPAM